MPEDMTPEYDVDPAADTQTFQAFVERREADEREATTVQRASTRRAALLALTALVILVALWLLLSH
jgi:hypothetical protein